MARINPEKFKIVKQVGRPDIIFSMEKLAGSSEIFFGSSDASVYRLDPLAEKSEPKKLHGHSSYVTGVAVAGEHVISAAYDRQLIWWRRDTGERVRSVHAHEKWLRGVVASPDGKLIASVADDMVCRVWDAGSGELRHELEGHEKETPNHYPSMLFACAFSPDGEHLATADKVGHIVVWDVASGDSVANLDAPGMYTWDPRQRRHSIGGIRSLCFSPDGKLLASGGIGKIGNVDHLGGKARVEIFDWRKGERTHEYPGEKFNGLVEHMVFHPEDPWLIIAGGDHKGFFQFLDLETTKPRHQLQAPMHVHEFAVSEDFQTVIAVGHQKVIAADFSG